jgi:hypothetical protein
MLTTKREGLDVDCLAINSQETGKLNEATLMRGEWFLQERLSSKKSVCFGMQMYWECSERLACEAFPEQMPSNILDRNLGVAATFRISMLLHKVPERRTQYHRPELQLRNPLYYWWMHSFNRVFFTVSADVRDRSFASFIGTRERLESFYRRRLLRRLMAKRHVLWTFVEPFCSLVQRQ